MLNSLRMTYFLLSLVELEHLIIKQEVPGSSPGASAIYRNMLELVDKHRLGRCAIKAWGFEYLYSDEI